MSLFTDERCICSTLSSAVRHNLSAAGENKINKANRLRKPHRWVAIGIIVPGLVVMLSGAALSFSDEIERFFEPKLLSVAAKGDIDRNVVHKMVAQQLQAHPDWRIWRLDYPAGPHDPITLGVFMARTGGVEASLAYLNPHTGQLLGSRPASTALSERLRRLHTGLISPQIGRYVAALSALGLLLMICLGGLLSRQNGRWMFTSRHAQIGLLIAPVLLLIILSGLWSVFGRGNLRAEPAQVTNIDQRSSITSQTLTNLSAQYPADCGKLPERFTARIDSYQLQCGSTATFTLDRFNPAQLQASPIEQGRHTLLWYLHSGEWAGLPGRAIWMWSVFAVAYLLYSGIGAWRGRRNGQ